MQCHGHIMFSSYVMLSRCYQFRTYGTISTVIGVGQPPPTCHLKSESPTVTPTCTAISCSHGSHEGANPLGQFCDSMASSSSSFFSEAHLPVVMCHYSKCSYVARASSFVILIFTVFSCVVAVCALCFISALLLFSSPRVCTLRSKALTKQRLTQNVLSVSSGCSSKPFHHEAFTLSRSLLHQKVFTQSICVIHKLCLHSKARVQQKFYTPCVCRATFVHHPVFRL